MSGPARRRYDNSSRRERATETRERMVTAGYELVGEGSIRDWGGLTMRAVAERAGVNERTVYRHFTNERGLRDAVMQRFEERAGVDLERLELDGIADVARRIVETVASHPRQRPPPLDPTLQDAGRRGREALLRALAPHTTAWSESDRAVAAAMFNALWRVSVYEHLALEWGLDDDEAVTGVTWVVRLLEEAVRANHQPGAATSKWRP